MSVLSFDIVAEFPDGYVNLETFREELAASADILTRLLDADIDLQTSTLELTFSAPLTSAEQTALTALIAAHNNRYTPDGVLARDAMLEAAAGNVYAEKTFGVSGTHRSVGLGGFELVADSPLPALPAPATADALTVVSDDAAESSTGATALLITYLDENLVEHKQIVPTNNTTPVTVAASALRLQSARIAATATQYGSNTGRLTLQIGSLVVGTIEPGAGIMQRAFYTVPAAKAAQLVSFNLSTDSSADVCEVRVRVAHPIDSPQCPAGTSFTCFIAAGTYQTASRYVGEAPPKTDIWFETRRLTGASDAALSVYANFYERPN